MFYSSALVDQRGSLGDKENFIGKYKKYHSSFGIRQLEHTSMHLSVTVT